MFWEGSCGAFTAIPSLDIDVDIDVFLKTLWISKATNKMGRERSLLLSSVNPVETNNWAAAYQIEPLLEDGRAVQTERAKLFASSSLLDRLRTVDTYTIPRRRGSNSSAAPSGKTR